MEEKFLKIEPMHDKKAFLRKVWVELANADVPLDVFNSDFSDVKIEEYHILSTKANFSANWQGDIGSYYDEPYEDFETYYEEIPYIGLERTYDCEIGWYDKRVEKTREEERQRRVTRYRKKTEWHFSNGRYSGEVKSFECVDPKGSFSSERYEKDVDSKYYIPFIDEELAKSKDMIITNQMMDRVAELHKKDGEKKMCSSLPGDTYENINYSFNCTPTCATLMRFPEYYTNIIYNGKAYERRAFAFGGMTLSGEKINNPLTTQDVVKKKMDDGKAYVKAKKDETDKAIKAKKDETDKAIKEKEFETTDITFKRTLDIDDKVWSETKIFLIASAALLLISIIMSLFLRYIVPVIILFVCAIAGLVVSKIFYKKTRTVTESVANIKNSADKLELEKYTNKLNAECADYADTLSSKCVEECKTHMDNITHECENYEKSRRADILNALNAKLASLGMPPASVDEYSV